MMDLKNIRIQIDEIDLALIELLNKRMALSESVAIEKIKIGQRIENKSREDEILETVALHSEAKLQNYTKTLYRVLFLLSKAYQLNLISRNELIETKIQEALDRLDFEEIQRLINM